MQVDGLPFVLTDCNRRTPALNGQNDAGGSGFDDNRGGRLRGAFLPVVGRASAAGHLARVNDARSNVRHAFRQAIAFEVFEVKAPAVVWQEETHVAALRSQIEAELAVLDIGQRNVEATDLAFLQGDGARDCALGLPCKAEARKNGGDVLHTLTRSFRRVATIFELAAPSRPAFSASRSSSA